MITILIATCNRPDKLVSCIQSIVANGYSQYEILIADQSDNQRSRDIIKKITGYNIRYFPLETKGKSIGLNLLLPHARGKYLAFTDDDCLVDRNWLKNIVIYFDNHPRVDGVLGKVLPYRGGPPRFNCPSVADFDKNYPISAENIIEYKFFGQGNNMSFRKTVFEKIGGFREWLGPGSVAGIAEDIEYLYRAVINGLIFVSEPSILLYHNRWLSEKESQELYLKYTSGLMALASYYLFYQRDKKMMRVINSKFQDRVISKIRQLIRLLVGRRKIKRSNTILEFRYVPWQIYAILKGLFWGFAYSLKDELFTPDPKVKPNDMKKKLITSV